MIERIESWKLALERLRSAPAVDWNEAVRLVAEIARLAVILDVVHGLTAPRFGRRSALPRQLTSEERARKTLGLPLAVQLTCDDIHQAYRRAAKAMHPDRGGSEQAFLDLAAARDILIHPGAHKGA